MQSTDPTAEQKEAPAGSRTTYELKYVRTMFDAIAGNYDFLNHLLSSGMDVRWRKRAVRIIAESQPKRILDVATGTGDFAIEAASLKPEEIIGVDPSTEMLKVAAAKISKLNLDGTIKLRAGQAEVLRFPDNTFDAATVAFGVRNFENLDGGLREIRRVLRPGGVLCVIEFSHPKRFPFKQLYRFYSRTVLPRVGGWISKNREAYEYLPGTVAQFPDTNEFIQILYNNGYKSVSGAPQTFGVVTIYTAFKK